MSYHVKVLIPRHIVRQSMDEIDKLGNEAPFALKCLWGALEAALAADPEEQGELVQVPDNISHGGLQFLLADILEGVKTGDSLEGHVSWLLPEADDAPADSFDVMAGWRIGNLQGQGFFRQIGHWERRADEDRAGEP